MKIKTSELSGAALDWAVAKCEGREFEAAESFLSYYDEGYMRYSTDWDQGGPIIERERITLRVDTTPGSSWVAFLDSAAIGHYPHRQRGPTPLIAAMRCFVASKLGDEVEIPEELCP